MKRLLLSLALLLTIGATCASAQVVFDAKGTADCTGNAVVGTTGKTCATLTVGSGANRALVCQVALSLKTPTSEVLTWDSGGTNQAMTLIVSQVGSGTVARSELWGLVAPTSGAKTAKMTWVGTSDITIECVSWTGVNQTGGATTFPHSTSATGTSAAPSVAITSATNNATMDSTCADAGIFASPTQTSTYIDNTPTNIGAAGSRAAGAATVTHTWATGDASSHWVSVGTDILAAGGGGGCTAPPNQLMMLGVGNCKGVE